MGGSGGLLLGSGAGRSCRRGAGWPELPAAMASRCGGARAVLLLGITLGAAVAQDSGCPSEVAARRVNDVMQACCPDGGRHRRAQAGDSPTCDLPEVCPNEECAVAFITLMDDCQDWLQQNWPPDQMAQFHRFRDRCEPLDPCSGSGLTLVDSGEVAHRDLDNGQDCRWSLSCTNNALSPRLHFTSFSTEANYDFVNLFDSATASGSAAETLHGNAVPRDWVATSSVAVVQYTSDGSVLRDGFVAQFDCVNAQSVPPPPPPRTSGECADDRDGTLASFGGCAAVVPPLGCAIDLSTVHPAMIPVGTLVSDLCPVSCDACPAAGEGSAYPGCGRNSNGVGVLNSGQIAYSAADMPHVAGIRIADPQWRRAWNVVDCRWVLQCTDDTLVPRVTFSAFATEVGHDYVRAWDGRLPNADRIADLHGSELPDAVVGFGTVMTLQYVSDASDDRFSQGDHFSASFDCIAGNPDAVPPADTYRCAMEFHSLVEVFLSGKRPSAMNLDADCGRRHKGSHLVSIHSAEDQAQLASITQANNVPSVWIGLNDIDSGKRAPDAAVIPTC